MLQAAKTLTRIALTAGILLASIVASICTIEAPTVALATGVYDVKNFGALGNGQHDDAPALNRAIAAANQAGGGTVLLPAGTYRSAGSVHMMSNVTIRLEAGATLLGAKYGYDPPELNPYATYQDTGHSHFHDAMIWGENLKNIAFVGSGTIDGGGNLLTGQPIRGRADKIISLARCEGLTISGITIRRGGHFAILINDCRNVRSNDLTILTAEDRDGWNVISSEDVRITNLVDHAYDDALVFKSDWALGATLPSGNVTVTNARLSSVCCNALMFGSETCGNFSHYRFSHIIITGAGKSGLGMVSMDGAKISDVEYSDVTMSGTGGAIMEKVGIRRSCGGSPGVGSISDIRYRNVTGTSLNTYTPTLWGQPDHPITDITFEDLHLRFPGGHSSVLVGAPTDDPYLYNPDSIGPRPSYGFYLHHVDGIHFRDSSFLLSSPEARPPLLVEDGDAISFEGVTAQSGWSTPFDIGLQGVRSYRMTDSHETGSGPLRASNLCGSLELSLDCFAVPPWLIPAVDPLT